MNVVSAIRNYITPQVQGIPGAELGGTQAIPLKEMRELPPVISEIGAPGAVNEAGSFSHILGRLVGEVGEKQTAASAALEGLLKGENVSLHQAMIAMEEASVSFQLMVEVRNKLLDSYQELMRMQV